jgi:hypothetical protein
MLRKITGFRYTEMIYENSRRKKRKHVDTIYKGTDANAAIVIDHSILWHVHLNLSKLYC